PGELHEAVGGGACDGRRVRRRVVEIRHPGRLSGGRLGLVRSPVSVPEPTIRAMAAISVLDAPSNLGLRMPAPGVVPGCYKLAGALRDQRLLDRIGAADAGCVVPPRYDVSGWRPGDGVFNAAAVAEYTVRLADRVGRHLDDGELLVVLGGDCSILFGP